MRSYPPAGSPILIKEITAALIKSLASKQEPFPLTPFVDNGYSSWKLTSLSSGRACLAMILKALSSIKNKNVVIIPPYTCPSIPAAIHKTGLRIRFCDFKSGTFEFDLDTLGSIETEDVLAVLLVHPYGYALDSREIKKFSKSKGLFLIEDVAQSLGAKIGEHPVGFSGDVSFFSFSKGKTITSMHGGMIATDNKEISDALEKVLAGVKKEKMLKNIKLFLECLGAKVLMDPLLYGYVKRVPFLKIGRNDYSTDFSIGRMPDFASFLLRQVFKRLEAINSSRREIAALYRKGIVDKYISFPVWPEGSEPAPIRFPIFIKQGDLREHILQQLEPLGVSPSYPVCLPQMEPISCMCQTERDQWRNARKISEQIVTLPTNFLIKPEVVSRIIDRINRLQKEHDGTT